MSEEEKITGGEPISNDVQQNDEQQVNGENTNTNSFVTNTTNEQQETKNSELITQEMEVHHHSHGGHGKKNWKNYFWEFLMLFLAVFCGFLAEYKLEHVIEHNREREYMLSLIQDLKADTVQLNTYIGWRREVNRDFDSLTTLLKRDDRDNHAYNITTISGRTVLRFGLPDISEGTIDQLKNAGGLRLIHSLEVSNAINRHYLSVNRMKSFFETERMVRLQLLNSKNEVLDASQSQPAVLSPKAKESFRLFSNDPEKINRFHNNVNAATSLNRFFINQLDSVKNNSSRLIKLIQKEYHLE